MAAPTPIAVFEDVNSAATDTYTVTLTGLADGDTLVAVIGTSAQPTMTTPASGWDAELARTTHTGGAVWVYTDVVTDAGTYDTTPTWVLSGTNKGVLQVLRITGATAVDVSGTANTGSDVSCEVNSITTTVDECLVVHIVVQEDEVTFTPPSGATEQSDSATTGGAAGSNTSMSIATEEQASAGSTGSNVFTASSADDWLTYSLAVAPAASGLNVDVDVVDGVSEPQTVTPSLTSVPFVHTTEEATFTTLTNSFTIAKPGTAQAGDLALVYFATGAEPAVTSVPVGWTELTEARLDINSPGSGGKQWLFWKVLGPGEASTYTWQLSSSNYGCIAFLAIENADTSDPFDVVGEGSAPSVASATPTANTIDTLTVNALRLAFAHIEGDLTFTPPSGFDEEVDLAHSGGPAPESRTTISVASKVETDIGTKADAVFTATASDGWTAIQLAIRGTSGAGTINLSVPVVNGVGDSLTPVSFAGIIVDTVSGVGDPGNRLGTGMVVDAAEAVSGVLTPLNIPVAVVDGVGDVRQVGISLAGVSNAVLRTIDWRNGSWSLDDYAPIESVNGALTYIERVKLDFTQIPEDGRMGFAFINQASGGEANNLAFMVTKAQGAVDYDVQITDFNGNTRYGYTANGAIPAALLESEEFLILAWSHDDTAGTGFRFRLFDESYAKILDVSGQVSIALPTTPASADFKPFRAILTAQPILEPNGLHDGFMLWNKVCTDEECTQFPASGANPANLLLAIPCNDGTGATLANNMTGAGTQSLSLGGTLGGTHEWVVDPAAGNGVWSEGLNVLVEVAVGAGEVFVPPRQNNVNVRVVVGVGEAQDYDDNTVSWNRAARIGWSAL